MLKNVLCGYHYFYRVHIKTITKFLINLLKHVNYNLIDCICNATFQYLLEGEVYKQYIMLCALKEKNCKLQSPGNIL